ncbi:MAG: ImmA/IrrE family metallo-endopeptidase [Phycisphaerales bacterium]|nr:ImmA/IrrE family metallo-endopeptidase [Phycisphaerales bacterium]
MSPEVRRAFAAGDANKLWRLYGFRSPAELVLEDLAWALGVAVIEGPLDTADARLVRAATKGIIRVNRDIAQHGRKRFAIAHELGHWRLHAAISQLLACTKEDMLARYKESEPEAEANWFAAELLMPEALYLPAIAGNTPHPDVINGLANSFLVTRTAAAVRFVELCKEHCVFVMCEKGTIKWWRCSKELDGRLWIDAGTAVSPRTLAGQYFEGRMPEAETQAVGLCEWASRFPDYAEDALEAIIPLGNSGAVIAMIWLE